MLFLQPLLFARPAALRFREKRARCVISLFHAAWLHARMRACAVRTYSCAPRRCWPLVRTMQPTRLQLTALLLMLSNHRLLPRHDAVII